MTELLSKTDVADELDRISDLLGVQVAADEKAMVLVSGGLDSDVVARLGTAVLTPQRVKLATIIQDDMNPTHLQNAHGLAAELGIELVEIDLRGLNVEVLYRLAVGDRDERFDPRGLLDPARMKCSLRTVILSSYQDRGYVVLGTSNRTESRLGFFLPFGDGVWHVGPIAHLYKTEVRLLASALGTSARVCEQPPSAGFWSDQTDREDLGFWLVNQGPIQQERNFTDEEVEQAARLSDRLSEADIDLVLLALETHDDVSAVPAAGALGPDIVDALAAIVRRSSRLKTRPTGVSLGRRA